MTPGQQCWEPVGLVCSPEGQEEERPSGGGRDGPGQRAACPDKGARSCLAQPRPQASFALEGVRQGLRAGLGTQTLPGLAPPPWTWGITINPPVQDRGLALGLGGRVGERTVGATCGGAEHRASSRRRPPLLAPAFPCRQWVRWDAQETGGGAERGPSGLFRWLSDHTPCVAGPTAGAAHTQPRRAPHWSAVTSALCQQRPSGLWRTELLGLRPAPHPRPTH